MTLTLGTVWIVETLVAFLWRTPWSANLFHASKNPAYLAKTRFLIAKKCQARNSGLISYPKWVTKSMEGRQPLTAKQRLLDLVHDENLVDFVPNNKNGDREDGNDSGEKMPPLPGPVLLT